MRVAIHRGVWLCECVLILSMSLTMAFLRPRRGVGTVVEGFNAAVCSWHSSKSKSLPLRRIPFDGLDTKGVNGVRRQSRFLTNHGNLVAWPTPRFLSSRALCAATRTSDTSPSHSSQQHKQQQQQQQEEGGDSPVVDLKLVEFSPPEWKQSCKEPPVILLHGLLGSKRNFATFGKALTNQLQKKRRVIALDLRNHGDNHHDWRDNMSYTEMARDVLAILDREGFNNAVLVGHSMGGKVAKTLALLHPDRVAGLVVLDIAPVRYCPHNDSSWRAVKDIIDALVQLPLLPGKTKRDVDMELRSTVEDPALRAFVLTNLDQHRTSAEQQLLLRWKINIDAISSQFDTLAGFDVHETSGEGSLLKYHGDTFFIHGGQSRFVRHSHLETISTLFPNHMLTTIRGVGHWVHAEAPDDTLALLKRYLDR